MPPFTVLDRWERPRAIPFEVDANLAPLDAGAFEDVVTRAMGVWAETGSVGFVPATDQAGTRLLIRWDDGSAPEGALFGRDTSVAFTRRTVPGLCEVVFDAQREWVLEATQASGPPSLFQTAVHELGHAIGLGHTEDERAVMHPQRENGRVVLGAADMAGIHTLYGGGRPGPGDLLLDRGSRPLHRVAPPGRAEWAVFDTDGDGTDELLVWDTAGPLGALTAYHFEPGAHQPLLSRTSGPTLGVAGYGAKVRPWTGPDGARYLDVVWPDGSAVRRSFDDGGSLDSGSAIQGLDDEAFEVRRSGDLDGDGQIETIAARG